MQNGNSIANVNGNDCKKNEHPDKTRVYLIKSSRLRVSSTQEWAKTLRQLKQQIRSGSVLVGGFQDHFC